MAIIASKHAPGFWGGLILQPINPKAYAVNTALFSGFPLFPDSLFVETALKFLVLNAMWIPIHLLWLAAGVSLRKLDLPDKAQFAINVAMALAMLAVVFLAAFASA